MRFWIGGILFLDFDYVKDDSDKSGNSYEMTENIYKIINLALKATHYTHKVQYVIKLSL